MAFEIEHKYLVKDDTYKSLATSSAKISQGYLCREPSRTVRIRLKDEVGYITVKGKTEGATRLEFEYEISKNDAERMLELCQPPILSKTRYIVHFSGHTWEVDEFHGPLQGLVTAEIELSKEDENYVKPSFVGRDVTGDPRYYNSNLQHLGI